MQVIPVNEQHLKVSTNSGISLKIQHMNIFVYSSQVPGKGQRSRGGGEALRRPVNQRGQGVRVWHRHQQHVRVLGLGRGEVFPVVRHRADHRPPPRLRQLREAS